MVPGKQGAEAGPRHVEGGRGERQGTPMHAGGCIGRGVRMVVQECRAGAQGGGEWQGCASDITKGRLRKGSTSSSEEDCVGQQQHHMYWNHVLRAGSDSSCSRCLQRADDLVHGNSMFNPTP
jgi:hypothetical protein